MTFKAYIQKQRKALGYSQNQLATLLGTAQSTVGHWETGRRVPSDKQIFKMALLFKEPAEKIFLIKNSTLRTKLKYK